MDIRTMEYYLAVTREGNISSAAETLHISQPSLSRQMKELEEELGVTLFERGSRRIRLTEEGMILRRRAEEMVRLMQMTESEIREAHNSISGEVHIGAGESVCFHSISETAGAILQDYPDIRFHITSGDTRDLLDQLDHGLIDLALIFTDYDHTLYHGLSLPQKETLGVLMRKDDPMADHEIITGADLQTMNLLVPRAARDLLSSNPLLTNIRITAVYNLIYNASLFVEDGVGYAIGFDSLINTGSDSVLTFRPLAGSHTQNGTVIWKKYEVLNPAVNLFLEMLKNHCADRPQNP